MTSPTGQPPVRLDAKQEVGRNQHGLEEPPLHPLLSRAPVGRQRHELRA
ncbi:MAG: hypothetical protein R3B90_02175 [Planctomycetaceae bacterium]